jgi:tetratricopeptide (TPR) repeat protein
LFIYFEAEVNAQNIEETIEFGNIAFAQKRYEAALAAYNRVFYFSENSVNPEILYNIGYCYDQVNHQNQLAQQFYDLCFFVGTDDSLKTEAILSKTKSLIAEENYQLALSELYEIDDTKDTIFKNRIEFLKGFIYYQTEDFKKAEEKFLSIAQTENSAKAIKDIFKDEKKFYRPKHRTAMFLSAFLPGLGQAYAGDYKNALNSFALNITLIGISTYVFYRYSPIDAALNAYPWLQRYYAGGYNKASEIAKAKLNLKRNDYLKDVLHALE